MEKYCGFCGKELVNEVCDCEAYQQAKLDIKVKTFGTKVWTFIKKAGKEIASVMDHPVDGINKKDKELSVSFAMGIISILLVFITNLINPMFLGYFWDLALKAEIALWMSIIPIFIIVTISCIVFLFKKKKKTKNEFKKVLATFSVAIAPPTMFYCIAYIFSFLWLPATIICMFLSGVSWIMLSTEAVASVLDNDRNLTYWVMFVVTVVTMIIIGVCGIEIMTRVVTGVMEIFNEYVEIFIYDMKELLIGFLNEVLLGTTL